jgi:hypothetical protein
MFIAERFISSLIKGYGKHSIYRLWYVVSTSLQILEIKASHTFHNWEKSYWKNNAVYQE